MFKNILIPTDGSVLSRKAVQNGIKFAKSIGAKVTGFTAIPNYYSEIYFDYVPPNILTRTEYKKQAEKTAQKHLAFIEAAAKSAKVKYQSYMKYDDFPAEAIIKAARSKRCDLIFMASHGRRGISRVLMGSEAFDILTKCKIPVLIYR